ncbi:MAG TPA: glycosyltransferase family 39 protein [Nitrospiraceae bacterium]|nr:glycosyltransferase family 39 protein [Nitrospiraceae bacterium]
MPAGRTLMLAAVIAVFFMSLAGSLPLLSRYHFDEGWYTNAAIEMVRAGDYLTPRYPDGSVRFRKPILTYWVLITSYAAFGIGLVSSRLPFLLAGGAVLWATYRMARSMTGDTSTALLATAVLGSNIQFMESATKATPDMLQCLFMTLSFWGAAELLFRRRHESHWYGLLYIGAGLAIATKGLLAAVMILFVWGFLRHGPPADRDGINLMHPGWLAAGLVIPLSWFVVSTFSQGTVAISMLFDDQIGGRLEGAQTRILPNLASYLLTPPRFFAPWILLIGIALFMRPGLLAGYMEQRKRLTRFVLGWLLVNIVIFSLGNLMRSRYLLPTYPLTAVLIADVLAQCLRERSAAFSIERVIRWVLIAGAGAGIIVVAAGVRLDESLLLGGGSLFALFIGTLSVVTFRRRLVPTGVAFGLAIMAAFGTLEQAIKPLLFTSPAEAIIHRLLNLDPPPSRIAAVDVRQSLSNLIRLLSGGRLIVREFPHGATAEALEQFPVILGSKRTKEAFATSQDYAAEECGATYDPPTIAALWEWIKTGEKPTDAFTNRTAYYLIKIRQR